MSKTLTIILAVVALGGFFFMGRCSKQVVEKTTVTTDTTVVIKTDTLVKIEPTYITEIRIDTLYKIIRDVDTVYLPAVQRYFAEEGVYDVWVSGIDPTLDSIKTYNKTKFIEVTNTVEKTVILKEWQFWLGAGIGERQGVVFPIMEIDILTPKGWGVSAGVGYFDKAPIYKATLKIKL